jgi:hemerythrin-like domain-containing protein
MEGEIRPIKRSEQLAPLSREHHEGLLAVWKIRQGLKTGIELKRIASFVQWFWNNDLRKHFSKEEKIIAPFLPGNDDLLERMIEEHQEIEALVHINEQIADEALLAQLADALNDHIRFEERVFFPHVEKLLSGEQLNKIQEQLGQEKEECPVWDDAFWIKAG